MHLRLTNAIADGKTWYGRWGYQVGTGCRSAPRLCLRVIYGCATMTKSPYRVTSASHPCPSTETSTAVFWVLDLIPTTHARCEPRRAARPRLLTHAIYTYIARVAATEPATMLPQATAVAAASLVVAALIFSSSSPSLQPPPPPPPPPPPAGPAHEMRFVSRLSS